MNEQLRIQDILTALNISATSQQTLREYPPITCIANGESELHEEGHVARVVLDADIVCRALEAQDIAVNRHAVLSAIRIHDSHRRKDHEVEQCHGQYAAEHAREVGTFDNDKDAELILQLAQWHSVDDHDICQALGVDELPLELQILKDADALDRVRDHYHESKGKGLDPDFLRLEESPTLIPLAQALCERDYADNHDNPLEAIISIGSEMGIII